MGGGGREGVNISNTRRRRRHIFVGPLHTLRYGPTIFSPGETSVRQELSKFASAPFAFFDLIVVCGRCFWLLWRGGGDGDGGGGWGGGGWRGREEGS